MGLGKHRESLHAVHSIRIDNSIELELHLGQQIEERRFALHHFFSSLLYGTHRVTGC